MRALLYKDFVITWRYSKLILFMALLFSILGGMKTEVSFIGVYAPLVLASLSLNTLAYDEKSGWLKYADGLPYGRTVIVQSKYLQSFLGCLVGMVLPALLVVLAGLIRGEMVLEGVPILMVGLLAAGTLNSVIVLPLSFRYDTNKGRIAFIVILAVLFGFGSQFLVAPVFEQLAGHMTWILTAAVAVCLVLWVVSYELSILFYRNKSI